MFEPSVNLPAEFQEQIAGRSAAELDQFSRYVHQMLGEAVPPAQIVLRLTGMGWPQGFTSWYVAASSLTAGAPQTVTGYAAYPRLAPNAIPTATTEELLHLLEANKLLGRSTYTLLAAILLCMLAATFDGTPMLGEALLSLACVLGLVAMVLSVMSARRAAMAMNMNMTATLACSILICLIPCGFFALLASLSSRINTFAKRQGFRIGFLGPIESEIEAEIGRHEHSASLTPPPIGSDR